MMHSKRQPGVVLPIVIGLLVLIELLAVVILTRAHQEHAVSTQRAAIVQAQLAARTAASRLSLYHPVVQTLPPGSRVPLPYSSAGPHESVAAVIERLTPALFLLRVNAEAGPQDHAARTSLGLVLSSFNPQSALAQLPAALNTAGDVMVAASASVDGSSAQQAPFGWSAAQCQSWLSMPDSTPGIAHAPGAQPVIDAHAIVQGSPPIEERSQLASPTAFDPLGDVGLAQLIALADHLEAGTVTLAPAALAGTCQTSTAGNWGAPLDAAHPCASYFPLVHSPGDLNIGGGAGQGLLIVQGDLTLAAGVRFFGLALVTGRLHLEPGSVLEGSVLVQAPAVSSTLTGGLVRRSNCALARALTETRALNRLALRQPRAWIPAF
jgi:hypothetical protein